MSKLQEFKTAINTLSNETKALKNKVKELQKAGKYEESSGLQSQLVYDRIKLRAAYLAYGLLNGRSLNVIENKTNSARPEGEYQMKYLSDQFWNFLTTYDGYTPLQKDSTTQMLKTHLRK